MEEERKPYVIEMGIEILSDDDETVKAIRIHGLKNDRMPLNLWCDFFGRLGWMTPGEPVMMTTWPAA